MYANATRSMLITRIHGWIADKVATQQVYSDLRIRGTAPWERDDHSQVLSTHLQRWTERTVCLGITRWKRSWRHSSTFFYRAMGYWEWRPSCSSAESNPLASAV